MDHQTQENSPSVLQLHRWSSSVGKIRVSDFSHAFISPTRQLLVLVSDKCEAMLFPVNEGGSSPPWDPDSTTCSLTERKTFSGGKTELFNNHPFIYGVQSVAWGICEDSYSQNKNELFREFMFIASDYGVVVHAFCHGNSKSIGVSHDQETFSFPGMWMEWGPTVSSCYVKMQENSVFSGEDFETVSRSKHMNENGDGEQNCLDNVLTVTGYDYKRWLRTYFTRVNTIDRDDAICTQFPGKSSFPSNAKVVSFNISSANVLSENDVYSDYISILDPISYVLSKFVHIKENISYKCSKVFSNNSNQLIGFVLHIVRPVQSIGHIENKIVLIARLHNEKLSWLCPVNLEYGPNKGPLADWIDFKFASNFVVCLSTSGLLSLYDIATGGRVAIFDILRTFQLKFVSVPQKQEFSWADSDIAYECTTETHSENPDSDIVGKIVFRRFIMVSNDSLLAIVDQFGMVYMIDDWPYVHDKLFLGEEYHPFLDVWEATGPGISQSRIFSQSFDHNSSSLFLANGGSSFVDGKASEWSKKSKRNWVSRCFVSDFNGVRKLFLPTAGFREDDFVFLSRFGVTRLIKKRGIINNTVGYKLVNSCLCVGLTVQDDTCLDFKHSVEEDFTGGVLACASRGYFYLVTDDGISVFLPSLLNSLQTSPIAVGYQKYVECAYCRDDTLFTAKEPSHPCVCSKVEVVDRILVNEGPEGADNLCLENGWGLNISRMRRLHLALRFLKFEDLERSLEMLVKLDLVGRGILNLLFRAVDIGFSNTINNSDVSAALRLLAIGTKFAITMIHNFGFVENIGDAVENSYICRQHTILKHPLQNSRMLKEMVQFLEIIRKLQRRLSQNHTHDATLVEPPAILGGRYEGSNLVQMSTTQSDSRLLDLIADTPPVEPPEHSLSIPLAWMDAGTEAPNSADTEIPMIEDKEKKGNGDMALVVCQGELSGRQVVSSENHKDPIPFEGISNLDLRAVVKNALLNSRLPLAVLQVHLHHFKGQCEGSEIHDTFSKVIDIGRSIAYELFLKGETGTALETLRKLGDDIKTSLRNLVFGSLRRRLRVQIVEETEKYEYLDFQELKILDKISVIERTYPGSSFWKAYYGKRGVDSSFLFSGNSSGECGSDMLNLHLFTGSSIQCGEVDGVVLGSWMTEDENDDLPYIVVDYTHSYWVAAVVWSHAWDMRTFDRVILDGPFPIDRIVLWESELEYSICHTDMDKVSDLLKAVPAHLLLNGCLHVSLNGMKFDLNSGRRKSLPDYSSDISFPGEMDVIWVDSSDIKLFLFTTCNPSSGLLSSFMEQELAKQFVFAREYWDGTEDILPLLFRSGLILYRCSQHGEHTASEDLIQNFHKLLAHHCTLFDLPNPLDLFFDHHNIFFDHNLLDGMLEVIGNNELSKWLIFSRIDGREFDASFSNSRSILPHNMVPGSNIRLPYNDEVIQTVEDISEVGGEMAALASLMFSPISIPNSLRSGSISRECNSTSQCTLESLQPIFYNFPTLWDMFVAACFGECSSSNMPPVMNNDFFHYLDWRDTVFFSWEKDTSLVQILPNWFSRNLQRLVRLYVQPPLDLQTGDNCFYREADLFFDANDDIEINPTSWEAAIQRHIEEELYTSSLEDTGISLEQKLQRGRPFGAFTHLLGLRIQKLQSENALRSNHDSTLQWRKYSQSDSQTLLSHITESEDSLLSTVKSLAITHFDDSVLVASCAMLLEICGLSAAPLRIDIASLRRISSFIESNQGSKYPKQFQRSSSSSHSLCQDGDIMQGLARALSDNHVNLHYGNHTKSRENEKASAYPPPTLALVLQHLERASLPPSNLGESCGSWLQNGSGDGTDMRLKQTTESQQWCLVRDFCQLHDIPLSLKYLALLAQDNDWVGFLSEAQTGGYTLEDVTQVATMEFSDQRLKAHLLTVLRSIQKNYGSSSYTESVDNGEFSCQNDNMDAHSELFEILAKCETLKNPGQDLLGKAKSLSWSILTLLASCFPDVSPLSCLTAWLEIIASRELSSIKVNNFALNISNNVGAAVESANSLSAESRAVVFHYNRRNPKRRRFAEMSVPCLQNSDSPYTDVNSFYFEQYVDDFAIKHNSPGLNDYSDVLGEPDHLGKIIVLLCQQRLFLPLLKAFEMFFPSCPLLPFIRSLQAFLQMRFPDASAHLGSFSSRINEEITDLQVENKQHIEFSWIISTAKKAADAVLSALPSSYEKRHLLRLLAATDFGDGGSSVADYKRLLIKFDLMDPYMMKDDPINLGNDSIDDVSLFTELIENREWEHARNWAKQLDIISEPSKSYVHIVTEKQAESMVTEWKEFLWDVQEERVALWNHCQSLFLKYSYPPLQAGLFFLRHVEAVGKDLPAPELHSLSLLSLQWLSGMITMSPPVCPLHLLREIETRVWLLAVESEAQMKSAGDISLASSIQITVGGNDGNTVDQTASVIAKMDSHMESMSKKDKGLPTHGNAPLVGGGGGSTRYGIPKAKRRAKSHIPLPKNADGSRSIIQEDGCSSSSRFQNVKIEISSSWWVDRVMPSDLERAVLSLLEFGQLSAAKQLQHKISPNGETPFEISLLDASFELGALSTPNRKVNVSSLGKGVSSVLRSNNLLPAGSHLDPLQTLDNLMNMLPEGRGKGLGQRIVAVVKAANVLGLPFEEVIRKPPIEMFQLLLLKAQHSFEEATLLLSSHSIPPASVAQILAESFLKGLLAAHRGGYLESQKEEGPAPLLWKFSDFLKWSALCPMEPEIGHALMRLVITGQEIPHACEVELMILSHRFYKSASCLDGVDVLIALAGNRVDAYVAEGDFSCLARLVTAVADFHTLDFVLGILIENEKLDLLLSKYAGVSEASGRTPEAVRGFRMVVLTSLKRYSPDDLDALAMVYTHFDMKHETASLMEWRAEEAYGRGLSRADKSDKNGDLLESMWHYIEAASVLSTIDAGNKTRKACAQASLVSLQIRIPDLCWLDLSETNARRALVDRSCFHEALVVAEAYGLNWPSEWVVVLWNQMLRPELLEQFVEDFVLVLPLHPSILVDISRFYRAEVAARGDRSQFSAWFAGGGGVPGDWAKQLGRSMRCLLSLMPDLKLRMHLATVATGFSDVVGGCAAALDRVPDAAGPLVLRKGHGGTYLPLM